MSDFDFYSNLWKSVAGQNKPRRKRVKSGSLKPGARFYVTERAREFDTKTFNVSSATLPSGFTNARAGNIFSYIAPDRDVWVQP